MFKALRCDQKVKNPDLLLTTDGVGLALRESFVKSRESFTASKTPPRFLGGMSATRAYKIKPQNMWWIPLIVCEVLKIDILHMTFTQFAHRWKRRLRSEPGSGVIGCANNRHKPGLWYWLPARGRHCWYAKVTCLQRHKREQIWVTESTKVSLKEHFTPKWSFVYQLLVPCCLEFLMKTLFFLRASMVNRESKTEKILFTLKLFK